MKKRDILNILFWTSLAILIILILWRIFGNSPGDLAIIITATFVILFKIWTISDNINIFKHEVRFSFHKVGEDINNLSTQLNNHETRLKQAENKQLKRK